GAPVVLLLEDWHWADEASHATLQHIAELVADHALLIVASCRPGLISGWGAPGRHVTIQLQPLAEAGSRTILESVLRADDVPADLVGRLHERTGGNPFFLEEIAHTLLEEGRLRVERGTVVLTDALDATE